MAEMPEHDSTIDDLTVEIVEFPYDMTAPEFGDTQAGLDGMVLHLDTLEPSADNSVVLKSIGDELIHLVTETSATETGIVDVTTPFAAPELIGYHYYVFSDELTIISEQALVLSL